MFQILKHFLVVVGQQDGLFVFVPSLFDQQIELFADFGRFGQDGRFVLPFFLLLGVGKKEEETSAFRFRAFGPDATVMLQNDGACQAKPDACTGNLPVYIFLRTVERFENLFRFLFAESFTSVGHFDKQVSGFYQDGAVLSREMGEQFAFCLCDRTDTDGHLSF